MADAADTGFMTTAFELAEKGRGKTAPNPLVGAVIVRGNRIVGKGFHRAAGKEHAEVCAIRMAGRKARGATLYVNLEPCCHTGRTGPCTNAIIEAGISRVVLSVKDPNPLVNGKGIRQLRKAGIEVETGLLKTEAKHLNDIYLGYHRNRRPYVILKLAQSLDGRIATLSGDSRWLSSRQSRRFAHRLRAEVDAVVVGAETVRRDNPALTVRHVSGPDPYRIIISESLSIPARSNLIANNSDLKTIVASTSKSLKRFSTSRRTNSPIMWTVKRTGKGRLDLSDFVSKANDFGLQSILVEGGAGLATSFLRAGLVDRLVLITAPVLIGHGVNSLNDLGIRRISKGVKLQGTRGFSSGPDRILIGYPKQD